MKTVSKKQIPQEKNYNEKIDEICWSYIKTVVEVVREPMVILDRNLNVISINEPFRHMFQIEEKKSIGMPIFKLGNNQWDIPDLHTLLEDILPKNTFFNDYEVTHAFPFIGDKSMILNAKLIESHTRKDTSALFPVIFLAIEDITPMVAIAQTLALHVKEIREKSFQRTLALEKHVEKLEKEILGYRHIPKGS